MAINKVTTDYSTGARSEAQLFVGRVIRTEERIEVRNWSDTMDYTDHRTTPCTYALVWLGTHGLPPGNSYRGDGRPMAQLEIHQYDADAVRDLAFYEQFGWIDCTNIFSDRHGYHLTAEVDASPETGGEPLMWANLLAWESHQRAEVARRAEIEAAAAAKEAAAAAVIAAKRAARNAKRAATEAASKAAAEAALARAPAKGTHVTVNGFTGTVFWKGVSKYYGKWNARVGVKDAKGNVQWIPAEQWTA